MCILYNVLGAQLLFLDYFSNLVNDLMIVLYRLWLEYRLLGHLLKLFCMVCVDRDPEGVCYCRKTVVRRIISTRSN